MEFGSVWSAQENTEAWEFTSGQPFHQTLDSGFFMAVSSTCWFGMYRMSQIISLAVWLHAPLQSGLCSLAFSVTSWV